MIVSSRAKFAGLLVAAASCVAVPAMAQSSSAGGQQFTGQLDARSPSNEGRKYQVRTINLEAGKRYGIGAETEAFDPKLRLSFADDNDETIAEDDDGGEGTNAYLEFIPSRTGPYRVRVTSLNEDNGAYVLKLRNLAPLPALLRPTPVATSAIAFKHYANELSLQDGVVRGRRVDDYIFRFEAGKQVFLYMDAAKEDIDPYLEIFAEADRNGNQALASDDDGGTGRNAFLTFIPETSGNFIVRASSIADENVTGSYVLKVGQQP